MVSLIFGTPGSGKTTCGAWLVLLAKNSHRSAKAYY